MSHGLNAQERSSPEPEDLKLGNDAVNLDATILYADMAHSTRLVDKETRTRAAEAYKTTWCVRRKLSRIWKATITAYDGDRVMGVFVGGSKNTNAAKTALKINWALREIVNPANKRVYGDNGYELGHVIGIDTSSILACRIGVRNDNDIVWVGRAANYAAKLSGLSSDYPIFITAVVPRQTGSKCKIWGHS